MSKSLLVALLILIFSLPLLAPFARKGFFPTHDGGWAVVRLAEMHREVKDLQFPPRWSGYLNHGYGYPLFLFSYPFPYYVAEFFHLAGLGLIDSIKAEFGLTVILAGLAMFLLGNSQWGIKGGLLASALYLYAPYRLTNLYVRGSLGESLASVFFPLLFYLTYKMVKEPSTRLLAVTAVSIAAFILTHNVMVILFMPILLAWTGFHYLSVKKKERHMAPAISAFILSMLLSAFFWLPALIEKKFLILSTMPIAVRGHHFLQFEQLFQDMWGFGVTPPLFVGTILLSAGITGCVILLLRSKEHKLGIFVTTIILIAMFMLFPFSNAIWELPLLSHVDFPWRILGILMFLLAFTAGALSRLRLAKFLIPVVIGLAILTTTAYIKTQPVEAYTDFYFATNDATTTSMDEFMPVWVKDKAKERPHEEAIVVDGRVETITVSSDELRFQTELLSPGDVFINQLYFPGWKAYVDSKETIIATTTETGLMRISMPAGIHHLHLRFTRTPVRLLADSLSLIGFLLLLSMNLWSKKLYRFSS